MLNSLTDEQKLFINKIKDMKNGMLLLNAPAGTGKTFTIKQIIKINKINEYFFNNKKGNIIVLAPTRKACSLFKNDGIKCDTIHKFFNAIREIDDGTGEQYYVFNEPNQYYIKNTNMILVDECSMINDDMYEQFEKLSKNIPIIFTGDECQIPPVDLTKKNTELSKVFNLKNNCKFIINHRSKDSICNHYLEKFRKSISNKNRINIEKKVSNEFMLKHFKDNQDSIVLSWTNCKTNFHNKNIRKYLFQKNDEELKDYYEGETLIFSGYRKTDSKIYYTNDLINISKISQENIYLPFCNCKCFYDNSNNICGKCIDNDELIPNSTCEHLINNKIKKCAKCGIDGRRKSGIFLNFHKIIDQFSNVWFIPINNKKFYIILYQFKNYCLKIKSNKLWKMFYDFKTLYHPDLKYNYAMTIHKSQGSQYNNVFVDIDNIRFCKDIKLSSRLSYTAVSRMREVAYFIS